MQSAVSSSSSSLPQTASRRKFVPRCARGVVIEPSVKRVRHVEITESEYNSLCTANSSNFSFQVVSISSSSFNLPMQPSPQHQPKWMTLMDIEEENQEPIYLSEDEEEEEQARPVIINRLNQSSDSPCDPSVLVGDVLNNFNQDDRGRVNECFASIVKLRSQRYLSHAFRPSKPSSLAWLLNQKFVVDKDKYDPATWMRLGLATQLRGAPDLAPSVREYLRAEIGCTALSINHCQQLLHRTATLIEQDNEAVFVSCLATGVPVIVNWVGSLHALEPKDVVLMLASEPIRLGIAYYRDQITSLLKQQVSASQLPSFAHSSNLDGTTDKMERRFIEKVTTAQLVTTGTMFSYFSVLVSKVSDHFKLHVVPTIEKRIRDHREFNRLRRDRAWTLLKRYPPLTPETRTIAQV